jgi:hypothetical protein
VKGEAPASEVAGRSSLGDAGRHSARACSCSNAPLAIQVVTIMFGEDRQSNPCDLNNPAEHAFHL